MRQKILAILERLKTAGTYAAAVWGRLRDKLKAAQKNIPKIKTIFTPSPPPVVSPQPFNSRTTNPGYIPVLIKTSLDLPPLWGRLVRLWPEGAELISKFEIKKGRITALCFELGGNEYEDIRALVTETAKETSGYFVYKLAFKDSGQIKALSDEIIKAAAAEKSV
ncbi:MAG: hypothetical protein NTX59_12995 [Elusimicrobia bacterium]|nr:hypothetical protein [Elusimicrobiota bacterium]